MGRLFAFENSLVSRCSMFLDKKDSVEFYCGFLNLLQFEDRGN